MGWVGWVGGGPGGDSQPGTPHGLSAPGGARGKLPSTELVSRVSASLTEAPVKIHKVHQSHHASLPDTTKSQRASLPPRSTDQSQHPEARNPKPYQCSEGQVEEEGLQRRGQ